jgi:hypothetical protein
MYIKSISTVTGAVLLALTATASAAPMSVTSSELIAPQQTQAEPVAYRYRHHYRHYGYHHRYYHRYYGWNPGAAVAGTALGLATLPFALAGGDYYGYGYGSPYYGYYGGSYPYYGSYRHYGYGRGGHYATYGGGFHTGRSVGYRHMHR